MALTTRPNAPVRSLPSEQWKRTGRSAAAKRFVKAAQWAMRAFFCAAPVAGTELGNS